MVHNWRFEEINFDVLEERCIFAQIPDLEKEKSGVVLFKIQNFSRFPQNFLRSSSKKLHGETFQSPN